MRSTFSLTQNSKNSLWCSGDWEERKLKKSFGRGRFKPRSSQSLGAWSTPRPLRPLNIFFGGGVIIFCLFIFINQIVKLQVLQFFNPIIKFKAKLSKNNNRLRGNQWNMITSLDCQLLCCQNTFYKQFIWVYKLIFNNYKIFRPTQALGHNPVLRLSPQRGGDRLRQ